MYANIVVEVMHELHFIRSLQEMLCVDYQENNLKKIILLYRKKSFKSWFWKKITSLVCSKVMELDIKMQSRCETDFKNGS